MNYDIVKGISVFLIFIFLIVGLAQSASAYEIHAPNDTVKDNEIDDIEWVSSGNLDIPWKATSANTNKTLIKVEVINESWVYETVPYVLKVDDVNYEHTTAQISLAKAENGAKPIHSVLFVPENKTKSGKNTTSDLNQENENWCQIDHELKVELTAISVDSKKTPHAKFKLYKRGNPKLDIKIETVNNTKKSTSATSTKKSTLSTNAKKNKSVDVTTYSPEKEMMFKVKVKNSGKAWIECVKLDVNLTEFDLVSSNANLSENDIQASGNHLYADLGWLAKNEERSINFTVRSPSWDKVNSRLRFDPCNLTAIAIGDDILGYEYKGNRTLSGYPPDPEIKAYQRLYPFSSGPEAIYQSKSKSNSTKNSTNSTKSAEIYMSSWRIRGSTFNELKSYCVLRQSINNLQGYPVKNVSSKFSSVPEGLLVAKAFRDEEPVTYSDDDILDPSRDEISVQLPGNKGYDLSNQTFPKSLSSRKSYNVVYILVPTRPGKYKLDSFSTIGDCYGFNLSEKSEAVDITVHGARILVNKSIVTSGGGKVDVVVTVRNEGDRAASFNLTERVPKEAGLILDSIKLLHNGKSENDSIPLRDWELETRKEKNFASITVLAGPKPDEYYDIKYSIQPENLSNMDLPPAKVDFKDLNAYKGTVYSSFFKSGAEVTQEWDYYENRWEVTSKNWNASTGGWAEGWNPITKRWANETNSVPANGTMENQSLAVPPKGNSTLDKMKDFFTGFLPGGKQKDGSFLDKIKNFITGLLPGGKQKAASMSNSSVPKVPSVPGSSGS